MLFPELEGLSQEHGDTAQLVPTLCREEFHAPSYNPAPKQRRKPFKLVVEVKVEEMTAEESEFRNTNLKLTDVFEAAENEPH